MAGITAEPCVAGITAEPETGVAGITAEPGVAGITAEPGVASITAEPETSVAGITAEPGVVDHGRYITAEPASRRNQEGGRHHGGTRLWRVDGSGQSWVMRTEILGDEVWCGV